MRRRLEGPHDLEAERAALGACISAPEALSAVLGIVKEEDFYSERHRRMFAAISEAASENKEVDHQVARVYADEETGRALIDLYDSVPGTANAAIYAREVKKAAEARRVLNAAERIRQRCFSDDYRDAPAYALSEMEDIAREGSDAGAQTYAASLDAFAELIETRRKNEGVTGIRTGIGRMDLHLGGLNAGCSYIVAARPGMGKSLLVGQIAQTAANQGYRVLLQTPEMSAVQYLDRIAHSMANVDYERALQGKISEAEAEKVTDCARVVAKLPVYVDDHGTQTPARIRANVVRFKPDLLIVDYLQYVSPDKANPSRNHEVGAISRALTRIKSDFNIPVLLAAQLNRALEARADKRPTLADLRDSGEIEQDADAVIFLHRPGRWDPSAPQDEMELHCEKWRFGSLWQATMYLKPGANWLVNARGEVA